MDKINIKPAAMVLIRIVFFTASVTGSFYAGKYTGTLLTVNKMQSAQLDRYEAILKSDMSAINAFKSKGKTQ